MGDHRGLEQIAAKLRQDPAAARAPDVVAGAPDPLEAARHRTRRLDLNDEIDRAHVDAELERRGRGDRAEPAGLERLLDLEALVARDRAVVRTHELDAWLRVTLRCGELGELLRHALGEAPRVDEDDRGAVREDHVEEPGIDQRPHAAAVLGLGTRVIHVGRGHDDLQIEVRLRARVDDLDRAVPAQIPSHFAKWLLRRGQADPLGIRVASRDDEVRETLEREREMDAALGGRERVDLVDDDRVDGREAPARLAGEDEVERLGRRDEDLPGVLLLALALLRRRVAGAHVHGDRGRGAQRDEAGQRRAQVALDVVGEGLDRRDVDDARAFARLAHHPIEARQERGERLAAAGRRRHQRVVAARDAGPAVDLDGCRGAETLREPGARRLRELFERHAAV